MLPEVPAEVKAMVPEVDVSKIKDIELPAVSMSDIPSSQAELLELADKTATSAQSRIVSHATYVVEDPVARTLAIKSAVIGTAGIAAMIALRKRHGILRYPGTAAAATVAAAAAYPETSLPIIKEGGQRAWVLIKDAAAMITAPTAAPPEKEAEAAEAPASPAAAGEEASDGPAVVEAPAAATTAAAPASPQAADAAEKVAASDGVWSQARSAVGWTVDEVSSAPPNTAVNAGDAAADVAKVGVASEVAALDMAAAAGQKKEGVEDLGQSKTEDTATYPSRR